MSITVYLNNEEFAQIEHPQDLEQFRGQEGVEFDALTLDDADMLAYYGEQAHEACMAAVKDAGFVDMEQITAYAAFPMHPRCAAAYRCLQQIYNIYDHIGR